jgi:hypothetical protein
MSWFDEQGAPTEAGNQQQPGPRTEAGGGVEPFDEAVFWSILESYPPTNEGQRAAEAEVNRRFGASAPKLLDHPQRLDKWRFSDGRTFDAVGGAGGPSPTHARMLEGPGHGGGGAAGTLGGLAGIGAGGQVAGDPSFQFVYDNAMKALERSASAKGTLLTGGFIKAAQRHAGGLASTEFQNIYNRQMGVANLGLNAAQAASGAGTSYAGQVGATGANHAANQTGLITGQGNVNAAGQVGASNAWGQTIGNIANMAGGALAARQRPATPPYVPPTAGAPQTTTGGAFYDDPAWLYN